MNIIFDLCGVIVEWNPDKIIDKFFDIPNIKKLVKNDIIFHSDWKELDRGTLDREKAIKRASLRTGIPTKKIDEMIAYIPQSLLPITGTINLIKQLNKKKHSLFMLTNIPIFSIEYLEKEYSFFNYFIDTTVSCRINMIKPEPDIYEYSLRKYNLAINNTIFIDDSDINLEVASKLGIRSIKFNSPSQCEHELKHLGCL